MNKTVNGAVCAGILTLAAASVDAVPLTEQSLIHVAQFENSLALNGLSPSENFVTTNSSISHTLDTSSGFGSNVQGHASMMAGKSGILASTTVSPDVAGAISRISMYDTLAFSTQNGLNTDVSYEINFDGHLSNIDSTYLGLGGLAFAQTRVSIYDITGLSTWLDDNGNFSTNVVDSLVDRSIGLPVSSTNIQFAVGAQGIVDLFGFSDPASPIPTDSVIVDTSGTVFNFNLSKTGTFTADPTKKYGIEILSRSLIYGSGGLADYLNTSAFDFTNLNGATFSSGSGTFLSAATSVPEPSILALLGIGLIGFMTYKRNRQ